MPRTKVNDKIGQTIIKLKKELQLVDGWKIVNNKRLEFMFYQSNNREIMTIVKINQIYIPENIFNYSYGWIIKSSSRLNDDNMAIVKIIIKRLLYIEKKAAIEFKCV